MKNGITDIFFDLDHTLWDFDRNSALAFTAVLGKHCPEVNIDDFLLHYVPINAAYWQRYQFDQVTQEELRLGRLQDSFAKLGRRYATHLLARLSDEYIEHLPGNNHLLFGALEVLEYLAAKYNLHIITNGFSAVQKRKLEGAGIGRFFATVTDSEMAGAKKPSPVIFEYALKNAGTTADRSVMIGDSIDADVQGALGAGIAAIHYGSTSNDNTAGFYCIACLTELKKML